MAMSEENARNGPGFAEAAAEYCRLIEAMCQGRPKKMYTRLETALAQLHSAALLLRMESTEGKCEAPKGRDMPALFRALSGLLHEDVEEVELSYRSHSRGELDAMDQREVTRAGLLFTDLAELYDDVERGLSLWRLGSEAGRSHAVWEWRWGFEHHWGEHLLWAMRTVHELRYDVIKE